jgi:predicted nucleic acid-binding protein
VAAYYLDTSALVKRYIAEQGTAWVGALTDAAAGHTLSTVRLTGPELITAIVRRSRGGSIPPSEVPRILANFRFDWGSLYDIVEAREPIVSSAMNVAERFRLRGYDAVHLAAALEIHRQRQAEGLDPLTFISADTEQLGAADAEGLSVDDPDQHP